MDEWTRTDIEFAQRVEHLTGQTEGGYNGATLLNSTTAHDDGVEDVLTGSSGQDWFLFNNDGNGVQDRATDLSTFEAEFAEDMDFITGP